VLLGFLSHSVTLHATVRLFNSRVSYTERRYATKQKDLFAAARGLLPLQCQKLDSSHSILRQSLNPTCVRQLMLSLRL
jgi:hypothetical protein